MNYYNEINPYCCSWLLNLMSEGLIPDGYIDSRSITDVTPGDLAAFTQCHFFAGIAGWPLALRLAGWPEDREIWTGSCPCQPFSGIGRGFGFSDPRHLWPSWFRLIREYRPSVIFGEQVATALDWLDLVFNDLESITYACGALDLPAACAGARHQRQRLWFVADADEARWSNPARITAAEATAEKWAATGLVYSLPHQDLLGPFKPGEDWVVDGLSGQGSAVGAFGNSIYPPLAAEVIRSYMDVC